jgi:hypothetical protein
MSTQYTFEISSNPNRMAPRWLVFAACLVPLGILGQFLLAGLSLFRDSSYWEFHAILGSLLAIPIAVVALTPRFKREVRPLRHWAGMLGALYVLQVALIITSEELDSNLLQAAHVFNAGLLLVAGAVIVAKIEHSHRR